MTYPVVHVLTQGNLANQMVQYMVAHRLAAGVPGCRISNVNLPAWGIVHEILPSTGGPEVFVEGQYVDIGKLTQELVDGTTERVNLFAYGQWMSNFPTLEETKRLFPEDSARYPGYGPDHLVCNIRGGEVLDGRHPHYTLLPPEFYAALQERTGLKMVFVGQIEDNIYCRRLRALFPGATFRPSSGALADFQTFRNSVCLVPAISTFSWLAAWLSDARRVMLPVCGLLHPVQMPEVDLLPLSDKRYEFHLFPLNFSSPVEQFDEAHRAIDGRWRLMLPAAIAKLRKPSRDEFSRAETLQLYDEAFYLARYPDVAEVVAAGHLSSGREHFEASGFREGRHAFAFNEQWYARTYPMAAFEVGQGDYSSLLQHFVSVGQLRGYRPTPADAESGESI